MKNITTIKGIGEWPYELGETIVGDIFDCYGVRVFKGPGTVIGVDGSLKDATKTWRMDIESDNEKDSAWVIDDTRQLIAELACIVGMYEPKNNHNRMKRLEALRKARAFLTGDKT